METPINYPFVMVEHINRNTNEFMLDGIYFKFIKNEKDFHKQVDKFENPYVIYYYAVVNKAAELKGYVFDNRLKNYIKP